jgi:hypothetical protein
VTSKQGSFLVRCLAWHACSLRFLFQKAGRENARRPQRHRLAATGSQADDVAGARWAGWVCVRCPAGRCGHHHRVGLCPF